MDHIAAGDGFDVGTRVRAPSMTHPPIEGSAPLLRDLEAALLAAAAASSSMLVTAASAFAHPTPASSAHDQLDRERHSHDHDHDHDHQHQHQHQHQQQGESAAAGKSRSTSLLDALPVPNAPTADRRMESDPAAIAIAAAAATAANPLDPMEAYITHHRRRGLIVMSLLFVVGSVEYGVILPTLWLYLQSLGETRHVFLGIILSMFNVSQMIFSPILGFLSDRINMKSLLVCTLLINVGGNIMYSFAVGSWMVVLSRIVTGIGASQNAIIMSYLVRVTREDERTRIIATVTAFQNVGLLVGPGLNFALVYLDFSVGNFAVTPLTAPGFFVAVMSTLTCLLVFWTFVNPPHDPMIEGDPMVTLGADNAAANDAMRRKLSLRSLPFLARMRMAAREFVQPLKYLRSAPLLVVFLIQFAFLFNQVRHWRRAHA
jgi:hypothetical protein